MAGVRPLLFICVLLSGKSYLCLTTRAEENRFECRIFIYLLTYLFFKERKEIKGEELGLGAYPEMERHLLRVCMCFLIGIVSLLYCSHC